MVIVAENDHAAATRKAQYQARRKVGCVILTTLLTAFGWNTIDSGGIEGARLLEPMCILSVSYGMRTNT